MKRHLSAMLFGLLCAVAPGYAVAEVEIGYVSQKAFLGAKGERVGGSVEDLYYRTEVYSDQVVRTKRRQQTNLRFLDKSKLQVGADCEVRLDRFIYDPDSGSGEAVVNVAKGFVRYISGAATTKDRIVFLTPHVAVGLRGTDFIIAVAQDQTRVTVLEGEVEITPLAPGGQPAVVGVNQRGVVAAGATAVAVDTSLADTGARNMQNNPY